MYEVQKKVGKIRGDRGEGMTKNRTLLGLKELSVGSVLSTRDTGNDEHYLLKSI